MVRSHYRLNKKETLYTLSIADDVTIKGSHVRAHDQEMSQSHTADQPTAP